jgi:hypothetical protein
MATACRMPGMRWRCGNCGSRLTDFIVAGSHMGPRSGGTRRRGSCRSAWKQMARDDGSESRRPEPSWRRARP